MTLSFNSLSVSNSVTGNGWVLIDIADFNGDGYADLLWRNANTAEVDIWLGNGTGTSFTSIGIVGYIGSGYVYAGHGDFRGTGLSDIFFINNLTGNLWVWLNNLAGPGAAAPDRDLLINPSMEIDQAHEGAVVNYANALNYVTDQWFLTGSPGTATNITAQRSTDAPAGFAFSELMTIGTGGTVSASNILLFCQRLSGDQTGNLGFGTSAAQFISISFWMKSNQTGIMPFHMRHNYTGGSSTYLVEFNYTTANVWTHMSATFAGDTLHGTTVDAANDVTIGFGLTSGTTDMDTPNQWNVNTHHCTSSMWQLAAISGATLQISGVKLEASPVPVTTRFARRDSWSEIQASQRYFEKSYDAGVVPGTVNALNGSLQATMPGTNGVMALHAKATSDKDATWTIYSPVTGVSGMLADLSTATDVAATVANAGMNGATVTFTSVAGHKYSLHWTKNAQL